MYMPTCIYIAAQLMITCTHVYVCVSVTPAITLLMMCTSAQIKSTLKTYFFQDIKYFILVINAIE